MKKRRILSAYIAVLLIALTNVSVLCSCFLFKHIEDTNGEEDFSLCSITEEQIYSNSTSHVEIGAVSMRKGNVLNYSVKKFSGVKTLTKFTAGASNNYAFTISVAAAAGNLRVCFINNGAIIYDVKIGAVELVKISDVSGTCELRVAGESAAFSITIS